MTVKRKSKIFLFVAIAAVLISFITWVVFGNSMLMVSEYEIASGNLPKSFSGFRIAQISDLHNAEFGANNKKLISMLKDAQPDIILITGDLVDSRNTNIEIAIAFAQQAIDIAPTYYVTGNHEARISDYNELRYALEIAGVTVLENERIEIEESGEKIALIGVDDPSFMTDYLFGDSEAVMRSTLNELVSADDMYTVLLSHRPELFETYSDSGVDLVFSGHAHGGQFRLPFIGGLFAPNQGLFPKYDAGLYTDDNTNMIVSCGLGNSIFPLRFNNRPEIIVVELQRE